MPIPTTSDRTQPDPPNPPCEGGQVRRGAEVLPAAAGTDPPYEGGQVGATPDRGRLAESWDRGHLARPRPVATAAGRSLLVEELRLRANRMRRRDLKVIHRAKLGHPGGDLSAMDILATLYFGVLRVDSKRPDWPHRDRFIMSKGHASVALYTTLAEAGFFPMEELDTYAQPMSRLSGHPDATKLPGVEANTGPLGHGLPIGVGCALASKLDNADWRTFVLTGDGELQEGSNWEAAMAAAHYKLDNLTVVVDRNRLQLDDSTERVLGLDPLPDKWKAFGWSVAEVDGHDYGMLLDAFASLPFEAGKPSCIIANTHKGQGVSFMRDSRHWHHRIPTHEELEAALRELGEPEGEAAE